MSRPARTSARFLKLFVFVTGAAVMALEMSASRLIAPYFGTSQLVWANLIGLILIGLSTGYSYGGRLADRRPEPRLLYGIVLISGIYQALLPLISRPILNAMIHSWFGTPASVIIISFLSILLVFFPPVFALAIVSPFAIRLAVQEVGVAGHVAGGLYAASTLGSILGTFLPAFVIIPLLGTRATILIFASAQILVAIAGLANRRLIGALLVPIIAIPFIQGAIKPSSGNLFEQDTFYQYVQVQQEAGKHLLVVNEGGGIQSIYDPAHDLTGFYTDDFALLPYLLRPTAANQRGSAQAGQGVESERVMLIGSAGGTILRTWDRLVRKDIPLELQGVEIDPVVAGLGARYFGLTGREAKIINGDGRVVLAQSKEKQDLIVIDAYSNQLYIPFQLSTKEFFASVQEHLTPQGAVALNVNAVASSAGLLESFERTLAAVFPYTYEARVRGDWNYLLVGSQQPLQIDALRPLQQDPTLGSVAKELLADWHPVQVKGGMLLVDDHAPTEFLTNAMVLQQISSVTEK